jgi:PTH1 family peptidyl-tRNA hydrolase
MKYLIVGLGNIGEEYQDTRHNIGFMVLDAFADACGSVFTDRRYGSVSETRYRGKVLILLKPSTFVNLSGNSVSFWLRKEKIPVENLLIIVDDLALPLGSIRMRSKGGNGGHNGLAHISERLSTTDYSRIRFGIGNGFSKGSQVKYVLGKLNSDEKIFIGKRIDLVIEMIKSFVSVGTELTMTAFNKAGKFVPGSDSDASGSAD